MSIYVKNGMDDCSFSARYAEKLYNHTHEGKLCLYGWHYDNPGWSCGQNTDEDHLYECGVNWNEQDCGAMALRAHILMGDLQRIAARRAALDGKMLDEFKEVTREQALSVLRDERLVDVYFTYVYPYTLEGVDLERVQDIYNRWDDCIYADVFGGEAEPVSEEDKDYYQAYLDAVSAAAEQRIGKSICAAEVIFFARRLCRLLEVNAPQMIVNNEQKCLIEALVLHRHGVSKVILGPIPEEKAADPTV